jgi:hypothetical protein
MSWFTLTEDLRWAAPLPVGAEQLPFRYAHLSKAVSTMVRHPYNPNLSSLDPSDTGPPFRYVDVQAFAQYVGGNPTLWASTGHASREGFVRFRL